MKKTKMIIAVLALLLGMMCMGTAACFAASITGKYLRLSAVVNNTDPGYHTCTASAVRIGDTPRYMEIVISKTDKNGTTSRKSGHTKSSSMYTLQYVGKTTDSFTVDGSIYKGTVKDSSKLLQHFGIVP